MPHPGTTRGEHLAREPFTIALSAGYFGFFAHAGFLRALEKSQLKPQRVIGVSGGAISGGLWAAGVPAEELKRHLLELERGDFWDPGIPFPGLLKGRKFTALLEKILSSTGVKGTDETPVSFSAVTWNLLQRRVQVLSQGPLSTAIRASASHPFLFQGVRLNGDFLLDGGIGDRSGSSALRADERCLLHFLPSRGRRLLKADRENPVDTEIRHTLWARDLPKVSPFQLETGSRAFELALSYTQSWLNEAI